MSSFHRNRTTYGLLTLIVLLIGLASRRFMGDIPFVKTYVGDVLWALMVFFGFAFLFTRWPTKAIALATLIFSFSIESSQLYHAPWIDSLRATRLGGLVLGFTFVWSDMLCYSLGVLIGFVAETFLIPGRYQR
ncbi:ribosomal maturation YjgA family protein [Spirosoma migulaei]